MEGEAMGSMRKGWRAIGTLAFVTATLTGGAVFGLAPTAQAASARATTSTAAAVAPVTAPGISAPPDVVVGAADGSVNLNVTLTAPGVNPVTVNYATASGTTGSNTFCVGSSYGYVGQQGTLTFQPGVTSQTVRVPQLDCGASLSSGFQEFTLNLSGNSSDSTLVRARTQIDITGDAGRAFGCGLGCAGQRFLQHPRRLGGGGDGLLRHERDAYLRAGGDRPEHHRADPEPVRRGEGQELLGDSWHPNQRQDRRRHRRGDHRRQRRHPCDSAKDLGAAHHHGQHG